MFASTQFHHLFFWSSSSSTSTGIIIKFLTHCSFTIHSVNITNPFQQTSSNKWNYSHSDSEVTVAPKFYTILLELFNGEVIYRRPPTSKTALKSPPPPGLLMNLFWGHFSLWHLLCLLWKLRMHGALSVRIRRFLWRHDLAREWEWPPSFTVLRFRRGLCQLNEQKTLTKA